jgi:hypothetical protein
MSGKAFTRRMLVTLVTRAFKEDGKAVLKATEIKRYCEREGIDYGADHWGWQGKDIDDASKDAQRVGELQKWKAPPPEWKRAPVGWSLSLKADPTAYGAAKAWAEKNRWRPIYDGDK